MGMRRGAPPQVTCRTGRKTMNHLGNWIMGAVTLVLAICGLFVAARAGDGIGYYGGLGFFLFAIFFVYLLVKVSFDKAEDEAH
jgi:hypothetical protein